MHAYMLTHTHSRVKKTRKSDKKGYILDQIEENGREAKREKEEANAHTRKNTQKNK